MGDERYKIVPSSKSYESSSNNHSLNNSQYVHYPDPDSLKHRQDIRQCRMIYKTIHPLLPSTLEPGIIKEIAEFAIGQVAECKNDKCDEMIVIYHEDQYEIDTCLPYAYSYCENGYYCEKCSDGAIAAETCLVGGLCVNSDESCANCKKKIHNGCRSITCCCGNCAKKLCFLCEDKIFCIGCCIVLCPECALSVSPNEEELQSVCEYCVDDRKISCKKCGYSTTIEWLGNLRSGKLFICHFENCYEWMCVDCDGDERDFCDRH